MLLTLVLNLHFFKTLKRVLFIFPNAYNGYDNLNQPLEINKTLFNVLKKCKFNTNVNNMFFDIFHIK